ncbi:hypothetical protein C5F47_06555 [Nitrosopumilus cobalaminigenes]|uniref:Uncharacterized protein n=1 Tax=Nitrosopumilus cobalaminigenes TaxID=1470066 RepID=A0A7D5R9G7_9ARCH|nr:hypothetical protein [Nitrosopumilus cobalaminigenes]QLH03841.1 hypothetical protein C5F47_06555 [Nitrosopumilus cobalaminigenes]
MQKMIFSLVVLVTMIGITTNFAYSQEISHSTFQETAQIVIDKTISQNVTASITLQSTSIQEIKIPAELEQEIRTDPRIKAIILTNQDQCVLGVVDESCIMINVIRNPDDKGIIAIQDSTKEISSIYIDKINQVFDTNAKFHSVFLHSDDVSNLALETSGIISGRGMISAVYTLPMEDTSSMYEKISGILLPKIIRESGGFYDVAKKLSSDENSKMTFSWIPLDSKSLLQLKLSVDYPNKASDISNIKPLEFLNIENLQRSDYFSTGFYPLNSIIQVVILSSENTNVSDVRGNIVPTQTIDNEEIPTDITKEGWVFDPQEGQRIQGKYIFGEKLSVSNQELEFSLGGINLQKEKQEFDESIVVVVIITIVAIAASLFYLKGYKK